MGGVRGSFHAVLLAGGSGTRFWPASRVRRPKQLLALGGSRTLLADAWARARRIAPPARIWVAAPRALVPAIREALPELRDDRCIVEPTPRDTAPAVLLATATVARHDASAVVGLFPTDQLVRDERRFAAAVRAAAAAAAAEEGTLICLGVPATRPETRFGWLECAAPPRAGRAVPVTRFVEKPDARRARRFLRSGRHVWNAGMFVWRARDFLDEASRVAPDVARPVLPHLAGARGAWPRARRVSVDYAVMERARRVAVVPLDAGWDDLGSWDAAARRSGERDRPLVVDSPGTVVFGDQRVVAVVGVPDTVVVDTPDAVLVVARSQAERVREIVELLRRAGRTELL
jgi:mannose-1-phosphate guanylyltransferase